MTQEKCGLTLKNLSDVHRKTFRTSAAGFCLLSRLHSLHTNTMLNSAFFGFIGEFHLLDLSLIQQIRLFAYAKVSTLINLP